MKKVFVVALAVMLVIGLTIPAMAMYPAGRGKGFDAAGYNNRARLFNGLLGNADENRYLSGDGNPDTLFGYDYDTDYDKLGYYVPVPGTHLIMKWSKAWHMAIFGPDGIRHDDPADSGDRMPWNSDCWMTNHDTWTDANGKRHVAFLKVVWVGGGEGNLWDNDFEGTVKVFK